MGYKSFGCLKIDCMEFFDTKAACKRHFDEQHAEDHVPVPLSPELNVGTESIPEPNPGPSATSSDELSAATTNETTTNTSDLQLVLSLMEYCQACDGYFLSVDAMNKHPCKQADRSEPNAAAPLSTASAGFSDSNTADRPMGDAPDTPNNEDENDVKPVVSVPEQLAVGSDMSDGSGSPLPAPQPIRDEENASAVPIKKELSDEVSGNPATSISETAIRTVPASLIKCENLLDHPDPSQEQQYPSSSTSLTIVKAEEAQDKRIGEMQSKINMGSNPECGGYLPCKLEQVIPKSEQSERVNNNQKLKPEPEIITIDDDDDY